MKSVPIYVLVGEADQGGRGLGIWRQVESPWRKAGVPLTIHAVAGKGHQWLVGPKEADALEALAPETQPPLSDLCCGKPGAMPTLARA